MELIDELVHINPKSHSPLYLQIANALIGNIRLGRLRKGVKLPSSRKVALALGVNRMTVVAAFDELSAQGWIEVLPRIGTFVSENLPEVAPEKLSPGNEIFKIPHTTGFAFDQSKIVPIEISDFPKPGILEINDGFPETRLAPLEDLLRSMRRLSRLGVYKRFLSYGGASGTDKLRETLADYLGDTRGLAISKENILITRGAQMGLYLATKIISDPGDEIIVEEPNYRRPI
jgi:GntR family transcriptional regulator/MocR family aminotransferase